MRIKDIAAITVTVELSISDCIALADACGLASDGGRTDIGLVQALASALVSAAFAAYALCDDDDPPRTMRRMWAVHAPLITSAAPPIRIPVPRFIGYSDADER